MKHLLEKIPFVKPEILGNAESREIDNTAYSPSERQPWITGDNTNTTITDRVCGILEEKPTFGWVMFFLLSLSLLGLLRTSWIDSWEKRVRWLHRRHP